MVLAEKDSLTPQMYSQISSDLEIYYSDAYQAKKESLIDRIIEEIQKRFHLIKKSLFNPDADIVEECSSCGQTNPCSGSTTCNNQ